MKKLSSVAPNRFLQLLFGLFSVAFLATAAILSDRKDMFDGLWRIMSSTCKVATNTFDNGGYAGSFLNAGLVGLVCTGLFSLPKAKASAPSVIGFFLTVGFTFWGLNILNIWFSIAGVLLYCLIKRESLGANANAMLFSTGLAPLISDLLLRYPNATASGFSWYGFGIALGVGLIIGFFLPAGLAYAANVHKGFDLYSAAVPVGMTAFFLRAVLYQVLGGNLDKLKVGTSLDVASWNVTNIFCFVMFGLCIVVALLMGCTVKSYLNLLKDSGHGADYCSKYGNATFLMNVGIYGLFIVLYYNLVGATFNGVTFGCILCMLACCCSGSHPRNVLPIMLGYVAASFLFEELCVGTYSQQIDAQPIVIGLCFASGLCPITGKYGYVFGFMASILHFVLVTSVPLLHGGFCLYNGGFTAAFICLLFVPVLERFIKTKDERKAARLQKAK